MVVCGFSVPQTCLIWQFTFPLTWNIALSLKIGGLQIYLASACRTYTFWLHHQVLGLVTTVAYNISCLIFSAEHAIRLSGATVTHDYFDDFHGLHWKVSWIRSTFPCNTQGWPVLFPLQMQPLYSICQHQLYMISLAGGSIPKCARISCCTVLQSWFLHAAVYWTPFYVESSFCNMAFPGGSSAKLFLASVTNLRVFPRWGL